MAKKLLALVSALALLVCAVSVFTIVSVSADAALDEFVAAEVEKHPAQLSEFSSNNDYWSGMWSNWINGVADTEPVYGINIAAGANGGVTVAVKGAGSAKLGATLNSEYVLNGTHMVISAVTSETNTGFAIMFGSEKGGTPGAADSSTTGIVTFDFNAGTAVSNNHGSSGALSVIEASDVIKAMTAGASVISWGVADDGVVSITVTNAAGTVTGSIQDYPAAWTDRTKAYFSIVASGIDAKTNSVDVLAIHGGDAKCGAVIAAEEKEAARVEAFNALVEAEKTHYEALMAEWTGCNATYNNSDRHQMKESDEVGVNVWTKPHSTITVGAQTTSKIKLDGAHLVLDNITTTDPIVIGFSPVAYDEEGGADWGGANPIVTIDLVAGDIRHNPPTTAATILSGSDVVKAMANGVSVVTFDVAENNAVTLTIENAAGVASATMPVEGENPAWADRTEAYLAITYRCTNDNGASFDIVAFHGGDETCGVDVEDEPDEPTTEEPPVTEEPYVAPDCTTYPSYVPTVDVLKNPGYWAGGAYESAVDVVAAEKGVTVKFSGAGNQTFRTYCTQTYNLDGLHVSLRNLTGNGFSITFFSDDTATEAVEADVDYSTAALRFINYASGSVVMPKEPWDGLGTLEKTVEVDAFTTTVDIMVKKLDSGDWEYSINGNTITLTNEYVTGLIDDTSAVRVQFFENAWLSPAMGAHSFDVVALHDGLHADEKAAADKAEADKAAAKAVDDMVANLGEITLESGDAIQAAYDAYVALTPAQQALVAADTLTNWQAAKDAYDALVAAAEADKAAAKAVDDMVANLGEITLESGDDIQAAYDAYLALTDAQKALVAADTLTNWQAAKDAYDALVESQPETQPSTEPSTEPAGPTLNTTEIIAGDSKFYKVNTDVIVSNNNYHTGANIKLSDNDDGGVHCVLTAVGSARLGYNYTKEVTLNGTHVVISGLTATDEFAFILGKEPSVSENDHPAKSIFILYADGSARVYPGATQENPTIIEGSDSVRAFFNGVTTLISFAVDANGTVSVTVANEAGVTTGTFSGYGEAWEDHTKAYIGFATNSANGVREFDIVAVHDGSVECGETVNPDEAPVKAVEELIDAIGEEITLNSKDAIVAAVAAYEALTDAQKAVVANLDKLVAAVDAYSAIHYDQFRYKYNITVKVQKEEIDGYFGSKYDLETFDENNGLYVDHWMPIEDSMWANRAGYDFAVPLDGLQIVIKDFKSVKEAGQTISIGLMNDPGAWVDADAMIVWLLNSGKRDTEGAGEYGYLHAESKKNGLAVSKALWQTDFATDIWAADELVIEFAYDAEGQTVGVFVNGQFMGDCTMEDLGITDPNKVIPHFGLWGAGNCKYAVYSITSKAQADKIQAAIDAIEALDPEAADFEEQVEAAADLYKALDKNLRNYVTNYDKLAEAIESIDPSDPTEEPTEDPTEDPTEEPENPKTGEAVAVLPIALLIAAAGAVIISRKRK